MKWNDNDALLARADFLAKYHGMARKPHRCEDDGTGFCEAMNVAEALATVLRSALQEQREIADLLRRADVARGESWQDWKAQVAEVEKVRDALVAEIERLRSTWQPPPDDAPHCGHCPRCGEKRQEEWVGYPMLVCYTPGCSENPFERGSEGGR